jgi:hypothetical protein
MLIPLLLAVALAPQSPRPPVSLGQVTSSKEVALASDEELSAAAHLALSGKELRAA